MSDQLHDYATLLRGRGFRVTPQRQMILEAIDEGHAHTTLEEIYERVQAKAPAINRATIYRTLDFLCQQRLVAPAEIGGRKTYEIVGEEPHHHLVCRACGSEKQVGPAALRALAEALAHEQQFKMDMEHLVIFGWCEACEPAASSTV